MTALDSSHDLDVDPAPEAPARTATPLVVVTYGTDHHRFARLSDWVQTWLADRETPVRCVVQEGSSPPPADAEAIGMVARTELLALMAEATVVVGQGGPGTVLDARSSGRVPVVVPRLAALDEVVDDHQVAFCRRMAREGQAVLAESEARLHQVLDAAVAHPDLLLRAPDPSPVPRTVPQVTAMLDDVLSRPPGLLSLRRLVGRGRVSDPR